MTRGKKRDDFEIAWMILKRAEKGAFLTHILLSCRLDTTQAKRFLKDIAERGLVKAESYNGPTLGGPRGRHVLFVTTSLGRRFVQLYEELRSIYEGKAMEVKAFGEEA